MVQDDRTQEQGSGYAGGKIFPPIPRRPDLRARAFGGRGVGGRKNSSQ